MSRKTSADGSKRQSAPAFNNSLGRGRASALVAAREPGDKTAREQLRRRHVRAAPTNQEERGD